MSNVSVFDTLTSFVTDMMDIDKCRYIIKLRNCSISKNAHMIQFPKPFDWFQKRLWRIYWIEWAAIFYIQAIVDKNLSGFDFITVPIAAGLVITVVGKYIAKFYLGFTKLLGSIAGVGLFHSIADLLEAVLMFVIGINYSLISRFSEEKLPENPLDKYMEKMEWKYILKK